ncbi:hypothetical protein ACPZ19_29690 [Amycolatopsis lurida]
MSFPELDGHEILKNRLDELCRLTDESQRRMSILDVKLTSILQAERTQRDQLSDVQAALNAHTEMHAAHEARFDNIDARLRGQRPETN